jgi:hypothetical protein
MAANIWRKTDKNDTRKMKVKRRKNLKIAKPQMEIRACCEVKAGNCKTIEIIEHDGRLERKDFLEKLRNSKADVCIGIYQKVLIVLVKDYKEERWLVRQLEEEKLKHNKSKGMLFIVPEPDHDQEGSIRKLVDIVERHQSYDRSLFFYGKY